MGLHFSISLKDETEQERKTYALGSPGQALNEIIWPKQEVKSVLAEDFDFKIFHEIIRYEPNQIHYRLDWGPEEVLKIFKNLENAIKKNIGKLPKKYVVASGISSSNSGTILVDGVEWWISTGLNYAIGKSENGEEINLLADSSKIKIGKPYDGDFLSGGIKARLKMKIVGLTYYESVKTTFNEIYKICNCAKKNNRKIRMSIG